MAAGWHAWGMGRDEMRAGDADRKAVADQLKTALDEGRLDLSEYDERLQKTYSAKTFGDLNGLLDDLPGTVPPEHSQVQAYRAPSDSSCSAPGPQHPGNRLAWLAPGLGIFLVCTAIYLITSIGSGFHYFWPIWTLIPFVLGLFGRVNGGGRSSRRRDRRRN